MDACAALLVAACSAESDYGLDVPEAESEWQPLVRLARVHAVTPTLLRALERRAPASPKGLMNALQKRAGESARSNLQRTRSLLRILDACSEEGIRAVAFKGPLLAALAYGDIGLREFVDIDVLVSRHET